MPHGGEDVSFQMTSDLRGGKVLEEGRRGDVPYEYVAFDVHGGVSEEGIVDHGVDVMKVVFAEASGRRSRGVFGVGWPGEGVDEGGPFEVVFDHEGIEFREEGAGVAGRVGGRGMVGIGGLDGGDGGAFYDRGWIFAGFGFDVVVVVVDEEGFGKNGGADVHFLAAFGGCFLESRCCCLRHGFSFLLS